MHKNELMIPQNIYIESTNYCNATCRMCPNEKMKRTRGTMDLDTFKMLTAQISEMDYHNCTIYMHKEGEPLLDPNLIEKIRYAKMMLSDIESIAINTNAALLTEDYARALIDSGLDVIFFSLDSMVKERYESWRIGLDFENVLENIKQFIALNNSTGNKIHVVVQMLVSQDNQDEVAAYRRTWSAMGAEVFIKEMHNYLDVDIPGLQCEIHDEQIRICKDIFDTVVIYWNGDVGVCCWDYDNILNMGNIKDSKLYDIYNNVIYNELRQTMRTKNAKTLEPCVRCQRIFNDIGISGISTRDGKVNRQE